MNIVLKLGLNKVIYVQYAKVKLILMIPIMKFRKNNIIIN